MYKLYRYFDGKRYGTLRWIRSKNVWSSSNKLNIVAKSPKKIKLQLWLWKKNSNSVLSTFCEPFRRWAVLAVIWTLVRRHCCLSTLNLPANIQRDIRPPIWHLSLMLHKHRQVAFIFIFLGQWREAKIRLSVLEAGALPSERRRRCWFVWRRSGWSGPPSVPHDARSFYENTSKHAGCLENNYLLVCVHGSSFWSLNHN